MEESQELPYSLATRVINALKKDTRVTYDRKAKTFGLGVPTPAAAL